MADKEKYNYIEKAFSVSKDSYELPWKIEYMHPLDSNKRSTVYVSNYYYAANTLLNNIPVILAREELSYTLNQLLLRIESYPYFWPIEGEKIDPNGYDFYTNYQESGIVTYMNLTDSAKVILWNKLNIKDPIPQLEFDVSDDIEVEGKHLTKFSLTLEKAGPVSNLSFDLHTTKPMELLAVVYEPDITRYTVPKLLNLEALSVTKSSYTIDINLGKPIFAKRFTFVFAQNNAEENIYNVIQNYDFKTIEQKRERYNSLFDLINQSKDAYESESIFNDFLRDNPELQNYDLYVTDEIYTDDDIEDWSSERKEAYLKWREKTIAYKNQEKLKELTE